MRISIYLVGRTLPGFSELLSHLGKDFHAQLTTAFIDPPMTRSFRKEREQYEAETLLADLFRVAVPEADVAVFITRDDIFSEPLNYVFGISMGRASLVSTARLDPRFYGKVADAAAAAALFHKRVRKEVKHEIGHTMGLPHCDDQLCVMTFSNSIRDVDNKKDDFCDRCKKALQLM